MPIVFAGHTATHTNSQWMDCIYKTCKGQVSSTFSMDGDGSDAVQSPAEELLTLMAAERGRVFFRQRYETYEATDAPVDGPTLMHIYVELGGN